MRVIGRPHLLEFIQLHGEAAGAIQSWLREAEVATWASAHDIKKRYHRAQILQNGLVVFPLLSHHYLLKIQVNFPARVLLVVEVSVCTREQLPLEIVAPSGQRTSFQGGQHEH